MSNYWKQKIPPSGFPPLRPSGDGNGKGLGIASMVVGILSLCSCLLSYGSLFVSLLMGCVTLGFAIASRVIGGRFYGMGIAGLILGIVSVVIFAFLIVFFTFLKNIGLLPPELVIF